MNGNIIRFQGKVNKGSKPDELTEQILTLQNLYQSYRNNLKLLQTSGSIGSEEDVNELQQNLKVIETEIAKLTGLKE